MLWYLFTAPRSFTQVQLFLCYTSSSDSSLALDILAGNIFLRIEGPTFLEDAEEDEIKEPSSRNITELTTIFETRDFPGPSGRCIWGRVYLFCVIPAKQIRGRSYIKGSSNQLFIKHQKYF